MNKAESLDLIQAEYQRFMDTLTALGDRQSEDIPIDHGLTIKDMLAHLTAWEHELIGWLKVAHEGKVPEVPRFTDDFINGFNGRVYAATHDDKFSEIYDTFLRVHQEVLPLIQALPDDEKDSRWALWKSPNHPWSLIAGNTYEHYKEHGDEIRAWMERNPRGS